MRLSIMIMLSALSGIALSSSLAGSAPRVLKLEVITEQAATGDGGNAWGGHQCRIVRTKDGVFTAYTVAGEDDKSREWRLVQRRGGQWEVVAQGLAGKDPVNLLASPEGTLHVIGWPEARGTIWSGRPAKGEVEMRVRPIPGVGEGHWPYGSAGIDRQGNMSILSSEGGKPGKFRWAFYRAESNEWTSGITEMDYRHYYTYVIPHTDGGLALVSTRDVQWRTLGYQQPEGTFGYVFNAFRYWRTDRVGEKPLAELVSIEEKPTEKYPRVFCNAQNDAYLDLEGRMHILYRRSGASTGGREERRHAIFAADGSQVHDGEIPEEAGAFCRIFQDDQGRFYVLGSAGVIFPAGRGGLELGSPVELDLQGHAVEYSGYGIAAPRTGTPPANFIDIVFPSGRGAWWVYCRILLYGEEDQELNDGRNRP